MRDYGNDESMIFIFSLLKLLFCLITFIVYAAPAPTQGRAYILVYVYFAFTLLFNSKTFCSYAQLTLQARMDRKWRQWWPRPAKDPIDPKRSPTRTRRWLEMEVSASSSRPNCATLASWLRSRRFYRTRDSRFVLGKLRENIDTTLTSKLPLAESRATNYETLGALQHREVKVLLLLERRKGKQWGARFAHFIISIFSWMWPMTILCINLSFFSLFHKKLFSFFYSTTIFPFCLFSSMNWALFNELLNLNEIDKQKH